MQRRTALMVSVLAVIMLLAPLPASAASLERPRPRGGSQRCLAHRNSQWVNDNPADLQAILNFGVGGTAASTIIRGSYSLTFVGHQMSAVVAIDSTLGTSQAHADEIADATYRLRGHSIVIQSVGRDNAVITITKNGRSTSISKDHLIFPRGPGQRIDYTCSGTQLRLFPGASSLFTLHRRSLP